MTLHNVQIPTCRRENLHKDGENGSTLKIVLQTPNISYEPGDHLGVFPCNRTEIVNGVLKHLAVTDPDKSVQLQILKENHTPNGKTKNPHFDQN